MALSVTLISSVLSGFGISVKADTVVFKHQNVVGSQTCYADDTAEKTITEIPDVVQGMRINQPVFRAEGLTASKSYTAKQELKDGTVIKEETVTANASGVLEFMHARNCEMIEILDGGDVAASLGTEKEYTHGVMITYAPMSWQVYQRDENDKATITIKGVTEADDTEVSVEIDDDSENVTVTDRAFTYTKELSVGNHAITVKSGADTVATYENVAVGDVWVAAGQSNMTDMGAITDSFAPDTEDPINDNMHIIYAEDTTWHKMSHPAGEGRFFKTGTRTSPVTSFAREIAESESVPVGIVQSSVGGTYTYQWVSGIQDSDANSGYLFNALKSCFDKMPSHDVKGILWYQGCNDTDKDRLALNYKENQGKVFAAMRDFFGSDVPIITTQINDANQDSDLVRWSFVKDIQRKNEQLYDNVYVIGTGEQELGDTIHNNAASNVKLGAKWAKAAQNVAYGKNTVSFRQPTIDESTVKITGEKEITLTFKDTEGLKLQTGTKRIGITNVSGGGYKIALGDLKKEFNIRNRASKTITSSDTGLGTTLTVKSAELKDDKKTVVLTTEEELAGVVAIDCMYGKKFTPTLVDEATGESVLSFFNVIAKYEEATTPSEKRTVTLTYTSDGAPCANMSVKVEALGSAALNYETTTYKTDADGKVTMSLSDGSYVATTEKEIGVRNASENKFTVSGGSVTESCTIEKNDDVIPDNPTYTFGSAFNEIKAFNTSSLSETAIGDTGIKVSTSGSNYNNVVVMNNSTKSGTGYYPYGTGLPDNGYYLFLGSGGNSDVTATLKFTNPISKDKYIKITYAKPYATNNGGTNRSAGNANTFKVGDEIIDVQSGCDYDKWYTTTIKADKDISDVIVTLGKWSAVAISKIEVTESADTLELTAADNVTEKYVTNENQTVQYDAKVYNSITTLMDSDEVVARGGVDETASVTYSVNGYEGVTIDEAGLLTITPSAPAGNVTVSASNGQNTKSLTLTLKTVGSADAVQINGDEVITAGTSKKYTAIPMTDGVVIPARATKWEIEGATNGAEIATDGTLTVPSNAAEGVITIKATLTVTGSQTEEVSATLPVTIRTASSAKSPYTVQGIFFKNGETDITKASGIEGLILEKTDETEKSLIAVVKAYGEGGKLIAAAEKAIGEMPDGVSEMEFDLAFEKASSVKVYIVEAAEEAYPETENAYDIVKAEKDGSNLVKVVIMQNEKETDTDAYLLVAQYGGNSLKTVYSKNVTLRKGVNNIAVPNVEMGADNDVKLLLWDGLDTITPLAESMSEITEAEGETSGGTVISDEIFMTGEGSYKNVPLVSDWITGTKSGLGMGAGIMAPSGAPYGVDPSVVDVSTLNVSYSYDDNYPAPKADNALWYKTGAYLAGNSSGNNSIYARDGVDWEQKALPIGNGYMGAMLFGLPDKDQIQLNEETFWAAGYRGVQTSVGASNVNKNMSEGINGFMSVGNLFVDFNMPKNAQVKNYYRDLNLDDAVAHVQYEYDGTKYNREYFASYPKEAVAIRYTADKANALTFDVNPVSMHPGEVTVNDGEITIIGKLKDSEPYNAGGQAAWNQESDLEYCTKIKVIADGGTVTDGYNTVNVKNANAVTILVTAATDYDKDQFELKADGTVNMEKTPYKSARGVQAAIDKATSRMNGAAAMTYADLKAEHIADYKSQFDTVKFTLTDDSEICQTPTDELQGSYNSVVGTTATNGKTTVSYDASKYAALDKHLEELHFNYARYMMISSSRSTTMPATLQGKWCQSTAEIWGSCYCININMEMNYWFAGGANLLDSGKSLICWFNSQIPAGTVTAKNMYNVTPKSYTYSDGKIAFTDSTDDKDDVFIMHTKQAIMGTTDLTGGTNIQSAGNTAWLMYNLWDLYQTSGDKELLANDLYPIMRKAANFYTQYLYTNERKTTTDTAKYPDGYYYTTWAGRSPEQGPTHEGIKYDLQLVAGMYDYTIAAAETLGVDADKVAAWKEIRNHLEAPVELGADGEIKEWAEEVSYNTDASGNTIGDPVHRHISHLVGLYPGTLINRETPELLNGAKIVLQNRGDDSTGWSCSNKFLLWARTLEGDKALELFRYQLAKKTYSNLFDTHAPFQIDGNFGSAAGVMELLMQSQTGTVYILPALPTVWDKGEISGIKAKNGAEVSIKWNNGKATEIKIKPAKDGDITIGYEKDNALTLDGSDVTFTDGKYTIENAVKGTTYIFTSKD